MKKKANTTQASITAALSRLLADTYILYLKTQNCHWNVAGVQFFSLHKMFEEQYNALANAVDQLAERIRALNTLAPGSLSQFLKLTSLKEITKPLDTVKMLKELLNDHESLSASISHALQLTKQEEDEVTMDLLIQRKAEHEKTAWMLRSSLI